MSARDRDSDAVATLAEGAARNEFSETRRPAADDIRALTPADTLAGRYQIVRSLAGGGMGEVYEVEDLELHDRIALKTILPELASNARSIERFKREVQLARRVTHPSVCRMFELGHTQLDGNEIWFITMELLVGETLQQRLLRGALPTTEALPIARQLVAGLAAIHATGIIHRDLKPANIVLCHDGRAVIMDFGIARGAGTTDPFARAVTLHGELVGTPMYMAPEQVHGGELTARADIYALGVVLYEVITGELPYRGKPDPVSGEAARSYDPVPPRASVAGLDPRWDAAILRCLQLDPFQRFARVEDVLAALEHAPRAAEPAPSSASATHVVAGARRRWLAIGGIAAGVIAAAVGGYVIVAHGGHGAREARPSPPIAGGRPAVAIVVSPGARGDAHALAGAEALAAELGAGERVRVEPLDETTDEAIDASGEGSAAAAGATASGPTVASVTATTRGDQLALAVHVAPAGGEPFDLAVDGTPAELDELAARLADSVRARLGVASPTAAELAMARRAVVTPASAAVDYALGRDALRRHDATAARTHLEAAAAAAPDAPMVHAALATALASLGYEKRAAAEADRADALASGLGRTARLGIDALQAKTAGDWARAAELYGALWTFFPDDLSHGLDLADAQSHAGRNQELETTLGMMRRLPAPASADPRIDLVEADLAENRGDFKRELAAAERALALSDTPGRRALSARAHNCEGWARLQLGDATGAVQAYEAVLATAHALGDDVSAAGAMVNLANVRRRQGDLDGAMKLYRDALAIYDKNGAQRQKWVALNGSAILLASRGDLLGAQQMFEQARDVSHATGDVAGEANALVNIGAVAQSRGKLADAKAAEDEAISVARSLSDQRITGMAQAVLASIYYDLGDSAESRRRAELALAADDAAGAELDAAATRAQLASVMIDQHQLDEAIASARLAAEDLEKQDVPEQAAAAYAVLADAQLEARRLPDATASVDKARALADKGEDRGTRLIVELARVRVAAASGHGDAAAADAVRDQAKALGLVGLGLEARLAAAEIRHDDAARRAVAADARAAGFEAVARHADRAR